LLNSKNEEQKENHLSNVNSPKEVKEKLNNKYGLDIIEENEKEEKLLENIYNEGKSSSIKKISLKNEYSSKKKLNKEKIMSKEKIKKSQKNTPSSNSNYNKYLDKVNVGEINTPRKLDKQNYELFEKNGGTNRNKNDNKDIQKKNKFFNYSSEQKNIIQYQEIGMRKYSIISIDDFKNSPKNFENIDENLNKDLIENLINFEDSENKKGYLSNARLRRNGISADFEANIRLRKNSTFLPINNNNMPRFSIIKSLNSNNNIPENSSNKNLNQNSQFSGNNIINLNQDILNLNMNNGQNNNNKIPINKLNTKTKLNSSNKLFSLETDKMSNNEFIHYFNISYEREKKKQIDIILSNFNPNTELNNTDELLYFHTHQNPQINKSFDFNITTSGDVASSSLFVKNLRNYQNIKSESSLNNYEKDYLDSSCDSSVISINYKNIKPQKNNLSKNKSFNINKIKENILFDKINTNEKNLKDIQRKLKSLSPDGEKSKIKKINLGNHEEFKKDMLDNLPKFVKYKRDNDFVRYDYMTRLDNGLIYKEDLKNNLMNKLIPGNYINAENELFKLEILHPKFIQQKFSNGMPSFAAGKPIIKNSNESSKEYCLYYERKNLPKVFKDKDAFSVMTIFK